MSSRELQAGAVTRVFDAWVLAEAREAYEVAVHLGPQERAVLDEMPWPLRRGEWLAGRRAAKRVLEAAFGWAPERTQILPLESGAPSVWVDGALNADVVLNLSHTKSWAAAAVSTGRVGIDVCDDRDGPRLARIAERVLNPGEAESSGALQSPQQGAAVWALKEAGLKLFIGGVFDPGARAIVVESLSPPRVKAPVPMRVALLRLPDAALAIARDAVESAAP